MTQEQYAGFSQIYDIFMDDVPYEAWCDQTVQVLREHKIDSGIVADLGCGTGTLTEMLAEKGYDMIGIDLSYEMLQEALEKRERSGHNILYLCQDMREFELYGTCAAMVSRCDSINYLTSMEDLIQVFKLVNNYLDPDGIFIFDCNTDYKYRNIPEVIAENRDEGSFIWENAYDPQTQLNEYDLTLYVREDIGECEADDDSAAGDDPAETDDICGNTGHAAESCDAADEAGSGDDADSDGDEVWESDEEVRYARYDETHIQRAFTLDELKAAAQEAGLIWESARDADDDGDVRDTTERMIIVLREHGKTRQHATVQAL